MQRHVAYHLERLALYVLPDIEEQERGELASDQASNSQRPVENGGRQESIACDFTEEDKVSFLEVFDGRTSDKTLLGQQEAQNFDENLNLMQRAEPETSTGNKSFIITWLAVADAAEQNPASELGIWETIRTTNIPLLYFKPFIEAATMAADTDGAVHHNYETGADEAPVVEEPVEEPEDLPEEIPAPASEGSSDTEEYFDAEDAATHDAPEAEAAAAAEAEATAITEEEAEPTLTSVKNLGSVSERQRRYEEVEAMYHQSLEGLQKAQVPEPPSAHVRTHDWDDLEGPGRRTESFVRDFHERRVSPRFSQSSRSIRRERVDSARQVIANFEATYGDASIQSSHGPAQYYPRPDYPDCGDGPSYGDSAY